MSVKDLATGMLGEMVVANLGSMQGQEVMAKVAGNALPQATLSDKFIDLVNCLLPQP
jgi:hypothetical protein